MDTIETVARRILQLAHEGAFHSEREALEAIAKAIRRGILPIRSNADLQAAGRLGGLKGGHTKGATKRRGNSDYYRKIGELRRKSTE